MGKATWATRFSDAFSACLESNPSKPPSPTDLNRRLGRTPRNQINGREAALRRELLEASGFVKDTVDNRWRLA